jgi:hypothetical protein
MIFLLPDATQARRQWTTADPFPHLLLSDVIYPEEAAAVAAEYPPPDDPRWKTYSGPLEHGKQEGTVDLAGPATAAVHRYLASDEFVYWLRDVTHVEDLIADPALIGGGIHQAASGARLGMHVDFNVHPSDRDLVRAVNVILFVGDTVWPEDVGGTLWLGERHTEVYPQPGTLIVFEASDTSWHGHPDPIVDGAPLRRSVPAYYYRPIRDGETVEEHSTRFLEIERGRCPHKLDLPGMSIEVVDGRCSLCGGIL